MIIPHLDFMLMELPKAGKSADGIEVVIQNGNFHDMCSGLSFFCNSKPVRVTRTHDWPFLFWTQTSPRSFASSQTGSFGQEARQASIVSSYDRFTSGFGRESLPTRPLQRFQPRIAAKQSSLSRF